jgi:SAM-dependent methyltransferase
VDGAGILCLDYRLECQMDTGGLATYYDRLGRWNRVARGFGYGGGRSTLTVHRALADPAAGGRPTFTRLHDVIFEQLAGAEPRRVLDAGCGLGGTMIACAGRFRATAVGLTLSRSQADHANAAAASHGLSTRVQAVVRSYDDPPSGPFDLIVAIESLAHSPDPRRSVTALARVVAPGGTFVIVDDMPDADAGGAPDLATFMEGWNCPVLASEAINRDALTGAGLTVTTRIDLTPHCRPRTLPRIAQLIRLNRVVRCVVPSAAVRQVMDVHRGGLALERLLRRGLMRYTLLIARRPALQVS